MKNTLPPGPKGQPFVGNALQFQRDPLRFVREVQKAYPHMTSFTLGKEVIVMGFRPEHVRFCLMEHPRDFIKPNRPEARFNLRHLLGDGLLTIDGDFHRQQRRLVQPAFHRQRVEKYADTMVQATQEMLADWQPHTEINISQAMQYLTLRIIAQALFNIHDRQQITALGNAFTAVLEGPGQPAGLIKYLQWNLPFTAHGKSIAGKQTLDTFVYDLIARRRADKSDTGDVLSMLLEAPDAEANMSDQQIHDHVLTFVAAGHETAQNTLSWTFYLLSQHADKREKLLAELQSVLNGRPPTVADLVHLPYLEWVINESWRVYPPAWIQGRRAIHDIEMDGQLIPAGTIVMLSQWVLHNLSDIWGDPETFRPERWNPANEQKIPQGAYFPFGGGAHICIGMPFAQMETKLLLATILQRYTPQIVPGFPIVLQPRVTLRPKYGIRMQLEPTSKAAVKVITGS